MHVHLDTPMTPASVLLPRRRLLIALAVLMVALAAAAATAGGQALLTWDDPIQRAVEARRTAGFDEFFLTISRLGSTMVVLGLGAVAALVTWRRCPAVALAVVAATLSRPLLEFTLKATVTRDRPDFERLVNGTGYSFPSGHVMAAVALWGLLPVIVGLYTRRKLFWWASVVIAGSLIVGIAASRVYLGVHWFSDVTAGLVVGTFFLLGIEHVFLRAHLRYPCPLGPCDGDEVDADVGGKAVDTLDSVDAIEVPCPEAGAGKDKPASVERNLVATSAASASSE